MFDRFIRFFRLIRIIVMSGGEVEYLLEDGLTGLYRRDIFLRLLSRHLSLLERHSRPATIVFFDLDGLKKVNDLLGHEAGDAFIAAFASGLKASLRLSDLACRWGGDEFVVVIDGNEDEARIFTNRVVAATEKEDVSFSYGVSLVAEEGFNEALKKADSNMYEAKRSPRAGRD